MALGVTFPALQEPHEGKAVVSAARGPHRVAWRPGSLPWGHIEFHSWWPTPAPSSHVNTLPIWAGC